MKLNGKLNLNLIVIASAALVVAVAAFICFGAYQSGITLGTSLGTAVGTAVGSQKGVTDGIAAGREAGLSAEGTTDILGQKMEAVGKLQVLAAGVTLDNAQDVGTAYKAIEILKGDLVFTVDLQSAEITANDIEVAIFIEMPQVKFYLDEHESEKIMEVNKFSLITNAEDGVTAFLNSRAAIVNGVEGSLEDNIKGYRTLMESAKEAAIAQTKSLAETACGGTKIVKVGFKGE